MSKKRKPTAYTIAALLPLVLCSAYAQTQRYPAKGLVLSANPSAHTMVVSCEEIRDVMGPMVMSFTVPDAKSLTPLARGSMIEFTMVVNKDSTHAEKVLVRGYASAEREPSKSSRLQAMDEALRARATPLKLGDSVPDFTLTDQENRTVHFRQFAGKVVALNFVYTRCVLPEYCVRSSNNFGSLQKRFHDRLGKDLILLTVTFDPVHDQPEILREYAKRWKADPEYWHFLTGSVPDIQRLCDWLGVSSVPEEGLYVHSVRTAIIGRDGKLIANLEGNEFTAQQLADLVGEILH